MAADVGTIRADWNRNRRVTPINLNTMSDYWNTNPYNNVQQVRWVTSSACTAIDFDDLSEMMFNSVDVDYVPHIYEFIDDDNHRIRFCQETHGEHIEKIHDEPSYKLGDLNSLL